MLSGILALDLQVQAVCGAIRHIEDKQGEQSMGAPVPFLWEYKRVETNFSLLHSP